MEIATILRAARHQSGSLAGVKFPCVVDGVLVASTEEAVRVVEDLSEDTQIQVTPKLNTARMSYQEFKEKPPVGGLS